MRQFLQKQKSDNTLDFTKEQKFKLMQFANTDTNFLDRCDIICKEFDNVDDQFPNTQKRDS